MSAQVTDIGALRRFAADVGAALPALRRDTPAATAVLDRIAAAAADLDLRARRPLTVAAVGEFSAGKSLLLGVLVGDATLLPAAEPPTTGNVTALHLLPAAPGAPTGVRASSIALLSRSAAAELVEHLIGAIVGLVERYGLPYPVELIRGAHPTDDADGWRRVDDFGRAVWSMTGLNPELKRTLHELVRIRDAWLVGHQLLPANEPGPEQPIERSTLHEAITIGASRTQPEAFPEQHSGLPLPANARIDGPVLAALHPLVRRVTFACAVRPEAWPLGALLDEPGIEILDMPGLGSAGGERDAWLALRELRHVTCVLVVLHAMRPETQSVFTLRSFLERARACREQLANSQIVVAQRFDTLPIPPDGASAEFDSLTRMVRELSGNGSDLVAYTSAMAAMAVRNMGGPPGLPLLPATGLDAVRSAWAAVAAAQPGRPDAAAVTAFAADGGIDRLRAVLVSHVLDHGLSVHVAEMTAVRDSIRATLRSLPRLPTVAAPAEAEDRLLRLAAALKDTLAAMQGAVRDLRRVERLVIADGAALPAAIEALVATEVAGWEQWVRLTERVVDGAVRRQPGVAAAYERDDPFSWPGAEDDFRGDWAVRDLADQGVVVTSTAGFAEPFRETAVALDVAVERVFRDVVMTWTDRARSASGALHEVLVHDPTVLELVAEITPGDPRNGRSRARALGELESLAFVPHLLEDSLRAVPAGDPDAAFPLTAGRGYWWAPEAPPTEPMHRHYVVVLRTRRTLADALSQRLDHRMTALMSDLTARLDKVLRVITTGIPSRRELAGLRRSADPPAQAPDLIEALLDDRSRA